MPDEPVEALVRAARAWEAAGTRKTLHILHCAACERLEIEEGRWCEEAQRLGRELIDAAGDLVQAVRRVDRAST